MKHRSMSTTQRDAIPSLTTDYKDNLIYETEESLRSDPEQGQEGKGGEEGIEGLCDVHSRKRGRRERNDVGISSRGV